MKLKKKTAIIAGFTVGALLFATTAFADIVSKSGYDQLKDGIKITAEKASSEYDSYTMEMTAVLKANGKVLESNSAVDKFDRVKKAKETSNTSENSQGQVSTYYYYNDTNTTIRKGSDSDKIYVGEYPEGREFHVFDNPFAEDEFEDVERIVDAVVGSLKDHVIVKENPDGSKELSGSLSEMQIPTLINAVSSFVLKQEFHDSRIKTGWPNLTQDIAVKEVTGSAFVNKEGALENILALATITGKDPNGQVHELTIEILGNIKDINSTVVTKPDLNGKEVVKEIVKDRNVVNNPQKFVGTFKNNIVTEKDGQLVKAGERILEITHIDQNGLTGRYQEVYKPNYVGTAGKSEEFSFNATFLSKDMRDARFETAAGDGSNKEGHIYLDDYMGKVNFYINSDYIGMDLMFDSTFNPVLE
ncbi:hypothetical protein Desde_2370 [Desulfitobacterium dehalogenans ATCC 51507]|uniref:Uncharacterized protein n=1 Tax=Desulfitobacterium dehalogenans (strain ATCC 51507 / DSM 9161 / JW/IU-DC1) TaxID=756499 RepID=I4A9S3_DESDJ|nr:hypothetical protein [Desulfitobacterium dehalogenans]AFM00708.1 hypothetical protein Desde_2370 [Desulfitobacterium dehalogenans ATCC 51507]